jgi:hypothetical protein
MAGIVCHAHFEAIRNGHTGMTAEERIAAWMAEDAEQAACPDCQAAREKEADRIQREDTIDPNQPYGQHIDLYCVNHPELRWHTKNIGYIGARSIFFRGWMEGLKECACSGRDLRVVEVA